MLIFFKTKICSKTCKYYEKFGVTSVLKIMVQKSYFYISQMYKNLSDIIITNIKMCMLLYSDELGWGLTPLFIIIIKFIKIIVKIRCMLLHHGCIIQCLCLIFQMQCTYLSSEFQFALHFVQRWLIFVKFSLSLPF